MIFCGIVLASVFASAWLSPVVNDDLIYSYGFHTYLIDGGPFPSLKRMASEFMRFYTTVNSRLGDQTVFLMLLTPQWLYAVFYTLAMAGIYAMTMKISGISFRRNPYKVTAMIVMTVFLFPWYDAWMARVIFWNYIVMVLIALYALRLFINEQPGGRQQRHFSAGRMARLLVTGFLACAWHEQLAATMFLLIVVYGICRRDLSAGQLIMGAGGLSGGFYHIICPGLYFRLSSGTRFAPFGEVGWMIKYGILFCAILIAIALLGLWLRKRQKETKPAIMPALAGMWASVIISLILSKFVVIEGRIFFLPCTFCLVAALCCLPRKIRMPLRWKNSLCLAAAVLTVVHAAAVVRVDFLQRKDYDKLTEMMRTAMNPREIYFNTDYLKNGHWLALDKDFGRISMDPFYFNTCLPLYLGIKHNTIFNIIPPELKDFDPSRLRKVTEGYPVYLLGKRILVKDTVARDHICYGNILMEMDDCMRMVLSYYETVRVRSRNGDYWLYYNLKYRIFDNLRTLKKVVDITQNESDVETQVRNRIREYYAELPG